MGPVQALADDYLQRVCVLQPELATVLGIPGDPTGLTDYSPAGQAARDELARETLLSLEATAPEDEDDEWCARLLRDQLEGELAASAMGEHLRPLRQLASPVTALRKIFDIMPTATVDDWDHIAGRMARVPWACERLGEALREGVRRDIVAARRQILASIETLATWSGDRHAQPWFEQLAEQAPAEIQASPLAQRLRVEAQHATAAMATTRELIEREVLPASVDRDPVGRDRYAVLSRRFLGAAPDLDDAYEWGWEELRRIETEMLDVGRQIIPSASGVREVAEHLDREGEAAAGGEGLRAWAQDLIDRTIDDLDGRLVDLDPRMRRVEVMIEPEGTGASAASYSNPTLDFSRPGRVWYPVLGRERIPLWGEVTTAYHEAVPGHHLQGARGVINAPNRSLFQMATWIAGNGEGWALYAERLMDELNAFTTPATRFGYFSGQLLRAARVVIDIGVHCELKVPDGEQHAGEVLSSAYARELMVRRLADPMEVLDPELVRYLGWPGQAPAYKLGERVWLEGRAAARARRGDAFDLKAWHTAALDLPMLGLRDLADVLPGL